MKKRTIIYIACAVAVALIIAFAVYFIINTNKSVNTESEQKIVITKYSDNFEVEKTIEITDKKQIEEINKICENPSLEQDDTTPYLAIRNDIKIDLGNGKFFMIQEDLNEYCYYEDASSDTKLVIKMPEGLLDMIKNIIAQTISYSIDNSTSNSDSKYSERGVYYNTLNQPDAPHYYTIAMGEKNTGGYSINIETVDIDTKGNVEVVVKETSPGVDSIVTMAITYPTCMLTLDKLPNSIVVKNTEGKLFKNINF